MEIGTDVFHNAIVLSWDTLNPIKHIRRPYTSYLFMLRSKIFGLEKDCTSSKQFQEREMLLLSKMP